MAFYSALLDVPVTPIQEEIRFAMLRHDGNNAAACLGPMDKYHQPGHTGPSSTSPLASACRRLNSWCPRSADGCSNPAQHRQRPWLPSHHRRYRGQLAGPLRASRQLMTGGCVRTTTATSWSPLCISHSPGHQTCGLRRVGMPVRCSSTCLTTLESLSMWATAGGGLGHGQRHGGGGVELFLVA